MTELQTTIVDVTIFLDRARVTRRGRIALDTGLHRLEVAELPLAIDAASVRAAGRFSPGAAGGTARLLGVDVRKTFYQDTPTAQAKALEDQILQVEDADRVLADEADALAVQATFARSIAEKAGEHLARGIAFARADASQGTVLMTFIAQELARAQDALRAIHVRRRDLAKQLDQLRNQLQQLAASRARERHTAAIEVETTGPGEVTVDLIYVVTYAGWQPLYDVRLDDGQIELTYMGQIVQRTGEDWLDVRLALSTARPALAAVLPELKPWYVNIFQPAPVAPAARAGPMVKAAVVPVAQAAELPAAPAAAPVEMEDVTAGVESAGASVTFRLPQAANIPADGAPHKVTVARALLEPELDCVSAPRLTESAYRRAKVKNAADLTLLPGPAALFVDGDFIGTEPLDKVAPGEEFEMYFGVDDRIFIERELKAREVDKKPLQDRRRVHYGYEIEVRNLHPHPIALEVHDQFPVARHESIKVKLESADPKPAEQTELNELTWKLSLEPNAKQIVRFDFHVEHPAGLPVTGLP